MDGDKIGDSESLPSTEPRFDLLPDAEHPPAASSSHTISGKSFVPDSDDVLMLYQKIQWLKNRQKHLRICVESDKFRSESAEADSDELINVIETLQDSNYKKATADAIEELGISRLQLSNMLHLLAEDEGDTLSDEMVAVKKQILQLVEQHTKLSIEVTKEMEDVKNLEEEVLKMELELSELSTERMREVQRIAVRNELEKQAKEDASKNKRVEKLEIKFDHNTKVLCTMNHLIQSIIGGSTINWAKQDDMRELLLMVSKPIDVQIRESMEVQDAA